MGWLDIFRSKPAPTPIREVAPTARQIAAVRLQENVNNYPDFFDSLMDRYWSNGQWWFPIDGIPSIGGSQNKTRGLDRYVFNTDQQLRLQRDAARILYAREPVAKTIEGHLNAFVIGKGFKYTVKPKKDYQEQITPEQLRQYQEYFDQWSDAEQWPEREQECYTSKFVDGEFFLRVTVYKGAVRTRRLEPEHIQDPPGMSFVDGWFLGVKFAPDDMETPLAYGYKVEGKEWEEIPAKEVIHYKANVTRNVSRGISDLYPVLDDVKSIAQLSDNVREGAAARAEIAYMWSIKNATPAAVSRFADEQKDRSSYNSLTMKTDRSKGMKSGKAVAHGDNVEYTTMPQGDVEGSIAALQAALRMVGGRWCLPEYMTSADASNGNYASTQVAGGPFVRFVEREQNLLKRPFKQVYDLVMKQAVVTGVIPTSEYAKLDIQVECDSPVIEDKYQQAQMYEIERRNGVLSPQQWCAMAGRDYEDTQRDINEWNESNMQAAPAMGGTGAGGLFGGQQQGANNDTTGEEGQTTGEAEGTSNQGDEEGRGSGKEADSQKPVKENWDENKHPRDEGGKFARFERGKRLSSEEKKKVLKTVRDVYKDSNVQKSELKGYTRDGDEIYGYPHLPELFVKSDVTGSKVRHYITLPDGTKAHPTELHPNLTQAEIDKAFNEVEHEEQKKKQEEKQKLDRVSKDKSEANAKYKATNRPMLHSYFSSNDKGEWVRVDGTDIDEQAFYLSKGYIKSSQAVVPTHPVNDSTDLNNETKATRRRIEELLKSGVYVPDEVMAFYPDLQAKYKKPAGNG